MEDNNSQEDEDVIYFFSQLSGIENLTKKNIIETLKKVRKGRKNLENEIIIYIFEKGKISNSEKEIIISLCQVCIGLYEYACNLAIEDGLTEILDTLLSLPDIEIDICAVINYNYLPLLRYMFDYLHYPIFKYGDISKSNNCANWRVEEGYESLRRFMEENLDSWNRGEFPNYDVKPAKG